MTSSVSCARLFVKMSESIDYENLKKGTESIVYVIQEIAGTKWGTPKINIMGAQKFGDIKVLLKEDSQIIFSPGPIIFSLRQKLKDFKEELFSGSVNRYVDEIIEVVEYVVERYNKENIRVSDTSFLYN